MNLDPSIVAFFKSGGPALYGGVFLIGLVYGLTTCSFSCLPVVGTYIMGTRQSFSGGIKATIIFSLAKVAGYTAMGILCGFIGNIAKTYLNSPMVLVACGGVIFMVGILLLFSKQRHGCDSQKCSPASRTKQSPVHLIAIGLGMSFIPCLPYTAIMAGAAASGSALLGGAAAFFFRDGNSAFPVALVRWRHRLAGRTNRRKNPGSKSYYPQNWRRHDYPDGRENTSCRILKYRNIARRSALSK
jgi:sulfite exporter TauE/SafE